MYLSKRVSLLYDLFTLRNSISDVALSIVGVKIIDKIQEECS